MFKFIKILFERSITDTDNEYDVWNVEKIVRMMLNIELGSRHKRRDSILPLRAKDIKYHYSEEYFYRQLLSALKAFKGDMEWETYDDAQLITHMVSERFSDDKKARFIELLGELNSATRYAINTKEVFDPFGRVDMIKMLLDFIYAARTFEKAWNKYMAFSLAGSVIWSFLAHSSLKYMNGPLEKAFNMICLLLGDDYDIPIPTSELKKRFGYPNISNKDLGEMWEEEKYS